MSNIGHSFLRIPVYKCMLFGLLAIQFSFRAFYYEICKFVVGSFVSFLLFSLFISVIWIVSNKELRHVWSELKLATLVGDFNFVVMLHRYDYGNVLLEYYAIWPMVS